MSYPELDILLVKEQANRTTQGTALDHTNFYLAGSDFTLEYKQDENKIPVALGTFGKMVDLPGKAHGEFTGVSYLSVNGISEPSFSPFLKSAGFAMTRVTSTTTGDTTLGSAVITVASLTGIEANTIVGFSAGFAQTSVYYTVQSIDTENSQITVNANAASSQTGVTVTFYLRQRRWVPSSWFANWTYLTMWKYTGIHAASSSKVTKVYSILNDATLESEVGKVLAINLTGKGCVDTVPADATYPATAVTVPSETILKMLKASTLAALGQTYSILKFTVATKNAIDLVQSGTAENGYKYADIHDADIEVTMTVYQNTNDPHTYLKSGAVGSFDIAFGDTSNKARIYSPNSKFQILSVDSSEDGKINTWDITGKITEHDLYIETGIA